MTTSVGGQSEGAAPEPSWTIRPGLIEAYGRSAAAVLADRLCDACQATLGPASLQDSQVGELRARVREHCAEQEGYLEPHQPVLETAFRVLLGAEDGAMPHDLLHRRIIDLWSSSTWPRHISSPSLERILDHSQHYGIERAAS